MTKKAKTVLISAAAVLMALIVLTAIPRRFTSQESFERAGGRLPFNIPAAAYDREYFMQNRFISEVYICSFCLDGEDYNSFKSELEYNYRLLSEEEKDRRYGYARWYGMKTAECFDPEYPLNDFPINLPYDMVTDQNIADWDIIVYLPTGTGGRSCGIIASPDKKEMICFAFYSM